MGVDFPRLFSEFAIGQCQLRNRIVSTGHHTYLAEKVPSEQLIAYHEARARGGVGLIISEIVAVHASAGFSGQLLTVEDHQALPFYHALCNACHRHDTRMFAQLFHPGREILSTSNGMLPIAWAPSAVPNERFHIMPKPMSVSLIQEVIHGYGHSASLLVEAGFDGFEIVASHGYLPAQFLNPRTNLRDDEYGGDAQGRLRFLLEVIRSIRAQTDGQVLGLRISASEFDESGLDQGEILQICTALSPYLDYLNLTAGTSASLGGSVHITPPMGIAAAYLAPLSQPIKQAVDIPVLLTGRINQAHAAEQLLEAGAADLCGMTRALIADPELPNKAQQGRSEEIRACIACNQSCIGRAHKGLAVSCIQNPQSGRELEFSEPPAIKNIRRILVAGGGPAGMQAASMAAQRGHQVTLCEATAQLGGQVLLAQQLPGRAEFGGLGTNLETELRRSGVEVRLNTTVTPALVEQMAVDTLLIATGAQPYVPDFAGSEEQHWMTAQAVLQGEDKPGATVVIADWRADWIGLGVAELLVRTGHSVILCVNAAMAGESLQIYTRNHYVGCLHQLGVTIRTHLRFAGAAGGSVFFQDTLCAKTIEIEQVDTLVLSLGYRALDELTDKLSGSVTDVRSIGDCIVPRSAEEAVYEGFMFGWNI